jgi:hypothetical protein
MKIYQEKNLNTPIFEGFISSILFYLILTIPLAFIYGMIRKQIERKEKHRVGYDFVPLIISKDGFQIITTKGQVMIPFNQVLKVSGWKKRTTTAAWFNSREIVYPFGKLNIKTINQKYNIKNIAYIEEVVFFLNHFISNPIKFRFVFTHASAVVPLPIKQSNTTSFSCVKCSIQFNGKSIGNTAECPFPPPSTENFHTLCVYFFV